MKFRHILLFAIIIGAVSCTSARRSRMTYTSLSVEAFERLIERENVLLVDVRTPEEHAKGAIEGTDMNLNVRNATFFSDYKQLPQDKVIALYCKGGGRSKQVAGVLAGNGYKVFELSTGYDGWVKHHEE